MDLLQKIIELKNIIDGYTDDSIMRELNALETKLKEQRFYIVVVGLFKRGKSTLINALLGKDITPVSVTPLTAIVSVIDYDAMPSVKIHFINGETLQTNIANIEEYVTEDKNPENIKQVSYVRILDDAPFLKNVSMVDTPGIGSSYEHNTEATLAFIPRIDAALFILSADIPVSKTDIELLKMLYKTAPQIIYVFNKADLLNEDDLQKITEHNKIVIAKELQISKDAIQLLIVSARQKNIQALKSKLSSFSKAEKTSLVKTSSLNQFNLLRSKAILQIQLKRDAFLMPLNELQTKQSQLHASIQLMNEQKDEFESIINGKVKLLQQTIHESVNDASKKLRDEVYVKIYTLVENNLSAEENTMALQRLNDLILNKFNGLKTEWEQKSKEHFKNLLSQYSQRSQSFLNELAKNLTALLNFNFELIAGQFDLNIYSSFYLTLDSGISPVYNQNTLMKTLFPKAAKKNLQTKWQQHYNEIIVRNTSAIIYDLQYKIQESFRKFNYDLNNRLDELLNNINKTLQDTQTERINKALVVEDRITHLNNKLQALQEL
ncbi:MAG TPA: dynamin family protein [Parafilimonas sp.]|nr:dynamin family protein [Parafilimonas sp.]